MSFFKSLLKNLLQNALQGAASASSNNGNVKDIGVSAGVTALAGLLQILLTHPATTSTVVTNAATITPVTIPPSV